MSEREDGFYWGRWANGGNGASWAPTWWDGEVGEWWIDGDYDDGFDIVEIGSRIPSPNAAPPIGTRYRDESGEVVAVVVPAILPAVMFDKATSGFDGADYHEELGRWVMMLDALPEPK